MLAGPSADHGPPSKYDEPNGKNERRHPEHQTRCPISVIGQHIDPGNRLLESFHSSPRNTCEPSVQPFERSKSLQVRQSGIVDASEMKLKHFEDRKFSHVRQPVACDLLAPLKG